MPEFDSSQPFSVIDSALAGSTPAKPSVIDTVFNPPVTPAAAVPAPSAVPEFDPSAPFSVVPTGPTPTFDPKAEFQKVFTIEDLKALPLDQLDKEKEFEPTDFGLQNEDALNADPEAKAKLLELYKLRNLPFHSTKQFLAQSPGAIATDVLKGVASAPVKGFHLLKDIASDVWQTAKNVNAAFNPLTVIPRVLGAASVGGQAGKAGVNVELNRAAGAAAEIPASIETAANRTIGFLTNSARTVGETGAALPGPLGEVTRDLTGAKPVSDMTPAELQARYTSDVAQKRATQDAAKGSGVMMEALGLNEKELKEAGIEIRPEIVQKLSTVTDPINLVMLGQGAAVGAVGKVGGRFVVEKVAQAGSAEQASLFVRAVNAGAEAAGKAVKATGEGLETAGGALREKVFKPLHDLGNVGSIVAAAGGNVGLGATLAGVTKLSAKGLELTGQAVKATAPFVATGARIGADVAGEFAKGYGHGLLFTLPFTIGADPTEREGLMAAAGLGGVARAGVRGIGLTGQIVGVKAQEALAGKIFEHVKQAKPPEVPDYGTDINLDSQARVNTAKLSEPQQNLLGWAKHTFKDSGVEFYPVTDAQFLQQTGGQGGRGFAVKLGQTIAPDGSTKPLVRIFLNGDVDAIPHEMLHALGNIDAPGYSDFVKSVNSTLTTGERAMFEQIYNTVQNGGLPESQWKTRLTPEKLDEEIAAEIFSRVVLGQDLSGVQPTLGRKAAQFASSLLEQIGIPLGDVNPAQAKDFNPKANRPGFSTLGLRPSAKAAGIGSDFVQGLLRHLEDSGDVLPGFQRPSLLKGGVVTGNPVIARKPGVKTPALVQPDLFKPAPPPPAAQPAPSVPTVLPTAPAIPKPRNIRTTEAKQGDFAARRHAETKIDEAKATAEKTGSPDVVKHVEEISKAVETGTPIEIEYQSVKNEGSSADPSGRTTRRTEQENAYIAEAMGALPADVRELAQKVTVPVRWETVAGKPQLLAMSLDKVIANVHKVAKEADARGVQSKIPYDIREGTLTPEAWHEVVQDFQDYADNQSNGYRGDGQKLNRPTEDIGVSIPAENPAHNPVQIPEGKANFLNLVQALNPPLTAREVKGAIPGNVKGQILAEINARTPERPSVIAAKDIKKQTFKTSGREIMETNPLRNELAAAGVPVRSLIEVTERLSTENIAKVTLRPDINLKAPVTDTIRGGFLPGGLDFFKQNSVTDIGAEILKATPEEWQKITTEMGGLTGGAYRLGVNLKDVADVTKLRDFEAQAVKAYEAAKTAQDFDAMFPAATKKQFFTEALETATDLNPKKRDTIARILGPDWKAPFPEAKPQGQFLPATEFSKDLDPIKEAAIQTKGGHVVTGSWHGEALDSLMQQLQSGELKEKFTATINPNEPESAYDRGELTDGFVTVSGKFLNREDAFAHADSIKQLDTNFIERNRKRVGFLESQDFKNARQFLPKVDKPEAVESAAVRDAETGEIFRGSTHGDAMRKASAAAGVPKEDFSLSASYTNPNYEQGFVTQAGDFLTRSEARQRVEEIGQIAPENIVESTQLGKGENLEAVGFQYFRKFLPGSAPNTFKPLRDIAEKVATAAGVKYTPVKGYASVNEDLGKRLADFYEQAKSDPTNPEVAASYAALADETMAQYRAIEAAGYTLEPFTGEGEPYKNSAEAVADIRDNKHLFVLATEGNFSGASDNPMLAPSGVKGLPTVNDVFRGVHDVFGHAKEGYQFGPRGEFNAWRVHAGMYSDAAQGALAAETLAQNSWVNFGPHLEGQDIPARERPFAEQKAVIVPTELIDEARGQLLPKTEAGRKLEKQGYSITSEPNETGTILNVVARRGDKRIGSISATVISPIQAHIADVSVNPPERRKGVGEALYRELGAELKERGIKRVDGIIVSPEALRRRAQVFPDSTAFSGGQELSIKDAEIRIKSGKYLSTVQSQIPADIQFLPKVKRDSEGRPLNPDGSIDFARFFKEDPEAWAKDQDARQASVVPGEEVTWTRGIKLPPTQLVQTKELSDVVGGKLKLIHYSNNNNLNQIDPRFFGKGYATPTDLRGGGKSFFYVDGSGLGADEYLFAVANKYGVVVDGNGIYDYAKDPRGFRKIVNREEQDNAIKTAGYSGFRTQTRDGRDVVALYKSVKPVMLEKSDVEGQSLPGGDEILPGLNLPSEEKAKQLRVKARVSKSQDKFPEALKLDYQKDDNGKFVLGEDGKPKPRATEYGFMGTPLAREAAKGLKGEERTRAVEQALGKKLTTEGRAALKRPDLQAGAKWYSTARTRLRGLFGDDSKFFTELLGATSARTPVEVNYRFALDAYNQFKQGKFDGILRKYRQGKTNWEARKLDDFFAANPENVDPTRGQYLDWWVEKNDLGPTKTNGKKFGANSRQVLKVLDGSWAEEIGGPKTPNFAGNLAGTTFEATVDVWAARLLHRLANEGNEKPWRILPEMETGVVDEDFAIGQAAYRYAAEKLGMKPDALQAVLWFAEKDHWEKNGWTRGAGAEKSDFNVLLKETEPAGSGTFRMKTPQQALDFDLKVSDLKKR